MLLDDGRCGGGGGSDAGGLVEEEEEEKIPLIFCFPAIQSLSGTGDRTGFVGETGLTIGDMGWKDV